MIYLSRAASRFLPLWCFEHPEDLPLALKLAPPPTDQEIQTEVPSVQGVLELLSHYASLGGGWDSRFFVEWIAREGGNARDTQRFFFNFKRSIPQPWRQKIEDALAEVRKHERFLKIREVVKGDLGGNTFEQIIAHCQEPDLREGIDSDIFEDDASGGRSIPTPFVRDGNPICALGGDLWGAIGGSKAGKSEFLKWYLSASVRSGLNVLLFDFENQKRIARADIGAALLQKSYPRGTGSEEARVVDVIWDNVRTAVDEHPHWGKFNVVIVAPGTPFSLETMEAHVTDFIAKHGRLDVLIVDYIDKEKINDPEIRQQHTKDDNAYEVALLSRILGLLRKHDCMGVTAFQSNRQAKSEADKAKKEGRAMDASACFISGSYSKVRLCAMNFFLRREQDRNILEPLAECRYSDMDGIAPAFKHHPSWKRGYLEPIENVKIESPIERAAARRSVIDRVKGILCGDLPPEGSPLFRLSNPRPPFAQGTWAAPKAAFDEWCGGDASLINEMGAWQIISQFNHTDGLRFYTTARLVEKGGTKGKFYIFKPKEHWRTE